MQPAGLATPHWEGEWGGGRGEAGGGGEVAGESRRKRGQAADLRHLGRFQGNRSACSRRPWTATFLGQPRRLLIETPVSSPRDPADDS